MDFGWCGNAYLEKRDNMLRQAMGLQPVLAKYSKEFGEETTKELMGELAKARGGK